jgi:menaquinone-dependent protoporphyrinogen oxidase
MEKGVLIAYASKYGSTREVAQRIGDVFNEEGMAADVRDVKKVKKMDGYRAVILGGPILMNKLRPAVIKLAQKYRNFLQKVPVAYFSLGVTMKTDNLDSRVQSTRYLDDLCRIREPVSLGLFAGKVDYSKVNPLFRWAFQKDDSGMLNEGDFRNWDVIEQWARNLAQLLPAGRNSTGNAPA